MTWASSRMKCSVSFVSHGMSQSDFPTIDCVSGRPAIAAKFLLQPRNSDFLFFQQMNCGMESRTFWNISFFNVRLFSVSFCSRIMASAGLGLPQSAVGIEKPEGHLYGSVQDRVARVLEDVAVRCHLLGPLHHFGLGMAG